MGDYGDILSSIFLTLMIQPVPMLLLRLLKGEPYPPKKARRIAIIDAIIVFVVWFFIFFFATLLSDEYVGTMSVTPIVFWGFVSYHVLKSGFKEAEIVKEKKEAVSPIFTEAQDLTILLEQTTSNSFDNMKVVNEKKEKLLISEDERINKLVENFEIPLYPIDD